MPFAKTRTGLEAGGLGLLLLAFGIGSIVAMPLAGALAGKYGCRRVLIAASLLVCIALPALATVSSAVLLAAALFVLGAGVGSVDCVINIQAVIVERAAGRALMSGFHGLFSVGGIAGAAGCAGMLSLGASLVTVSLVAARVHGGDAGLGGAAFSDLRWRHLRPGLRAAAWRRAVHSAFCASSSS